MALAAVATTATAMMAIASVCPVALSMGVKTWDLQSDHPTLDARENRNSAAGTRLAIGVGDYRVDAYTEIRVHHPQTRG